MAEFTSVLEIKGASGHERTTRAGEEKSTDDFVFPTGFVRPTSSPLLRVYAVVTRILRVLVRAFYLFPIFIVLKIVLFAMGANRQSDYITLVFVELVVALFGVFAIVMLMIAILGPRSKRAVMGKIVFGAPTASDAAGIIAAEVPTAGVHVTGRVDAGLEPGAVVLQESWGDSAGKLVRCVDASAFIVVPDEGTAVIVELETAPIVLTNADREETTLTIPGVGAVASLARFTLRQGDRVEVFARDGRPGTHPLLQNASATTPYRAESSALVVTSKTRERVVLRATSFE